MKTTKIDVAKSDKRKAAIEEWKARGPASNENSDAKLRDRVALLEAIMGIVV